MSRRATRPAVLLAVFAALPALAQERPVTTPTRDVDVTYRTSARGQVIEQRSRFRAVDEKRRLDLPSPGMHVILDQRAHTAAMVDDNGHAVIDAKLQGALAPGGFMPGQTFARRGSDRVAGLACMEWQTTDSQGQDVTVCITPDGVLLRARRGERVMVEATRVSYGPQDPAAFAIPPDYRRESVRSRQ